MARAATEVPRLLEGATYAASARRIAAAMGELPLPTATVSTLTTLTTLTALAGPVA